MVNPRGMEFVKLGKLCFCVNRIYQIRFDNEMVFLPLFRPEHRSFWRNRPEGER
jgi:hypothetical protein